LIYILTNSWDLSSDHFTVDHNLLMGDTRFEKRL